jgi:hypothetical protein
MPAKRRLKHTCRRSKSNNSEGCLRSQGRTAPVRQAFCSLKVQGAIREAGASNTQRVDQIFQEPDLSSAKLLVHHGDLSTCERLHNLVSSFARIRDKEAELRSRYELGEAIFSSFRNPWSD